MRDGFDVNLAKVLFDVLAVSEEDVFGNYEKLNTVKQQRPLSGNRISVMMRGKKVEEMMDFERNKSQYLNSICTWEEGHSWRTLDDYSGGLETS